MENTNTGFIAEKLSFELDGKAYTTSKPSIADFKELETHMKRSVYTEAARCAEGMPEQLASSIYEDARAVAAKIKVGNAEFNARANDPAELIYLSFLMFRHNHPDITLDAVNRIVTASLYDNLDKIKEQAGWTDEGANSPKKGVDAQ